MAHKYVSGGCAANEWTDREADRPDGSQTERRIGRQAERTAGRTDGRRAGRQAGRTAGGPSDKYVCCWMAGRTGRQEGRPAGWQECR